MAPGLDEVVRLADPEFYMAYSFDVYRRLRREAPVHWSERDQAWAVSRYDDVRQLSKSPATFGNRYGSSVGLVRANAEVGPPAIDPVDGRPIPHGARARYEAGAAVIGEHINTTDPPRHTLLRKIAQQAFTPRAVSLLEQEMEVVAQDLLDRIESGAEVDFVDAVAAPLPITVLARMLGVPDDMHADFRRWSDAFIEGGDADADPAAASERAASMTAFGEYFRAQLEERAKHPRDDLLTAFATAREEDGRILHSREQLAMCYVLLIAGNETTRSLLSNAALALHRHPDQRQVLVDEPSLVPNAVEETLRYQAPVTHMCRTALDDVELRGQKIARGDYIVMLYTAANHDDDVWERADDLDVTRVPDPAHLAFGFGEHFCLGANLARREARIMLGELLRRFPNFEVLVDEPSRARAHMTPGITRMPVAFRG